MQVAHLPLDFECIEGIGKADHAEYGDTARNDGSGNERAKTGEELSGNAQFGHQVFHVLAPRSEIDRRGCCPRLVNTRLIATICS